MCKYLNLRCSSISVFKTVQMHSLIFIDIRDTPIISVDLRNCDKLKKVAADVH